MFMSIAETMTPQFVPGDEPALICAEAPFQRAFHYWRGASGKRYLHSVYSLVGCPVIPQANYILVRREDDGSRTPLLIGQTTEDTLSLNLASLRHEGAKRGANEVHIHLLAETASERDSVERDLREARSEQIPVAFAA
jgi:hypothetical protein